MITRLIKLHGRLGTGKVARISEVDWDKVKDIPWSINKSGYAIGSKYLGNSITQQLKMHRVIVDAPKGMDVDHINGDKLDNRRENLRVATRSQNASNRHKVNSNNTSGYLGVRLSNKKYGHWIARITVHRKRIYLGLFKSPQEASMAYLKARKEYHGI